MHACRFGRSALRGRCLSLMLAQLVDAKKACDLMKALDGDQADGNLARHLLRALLGGIHKLQTCSISICNFGGTCNFISRYDGAWSCSRCGRYKPAAELAVDKLMAALPSAAELATWGSK